MKLTPREPSEAERLAKALLADFEADVIDEAAAELRRLAALSESNAIDALNYESRIARLQAENDALRAMHDLKTVMVAAAEEIHAHWDAHCDAEGYGPQNLMRRLEEGIPSEYGYTAGAFAAQQKRISELEAQRVPLTDEQIATIVRLAIRGSAMRRDGLTSHRIARAIERAHGIEPTNQRESA